jgi:two-component system response regulator HydG
VSSILIVDEDLDDARRARDGLRRLGLAADAASPGDDAAAALARPALRVVVVGIADVTGLALCAALRDLQPATAVIAAAAGRDAATVLRALRAGAGDLIGRPLELDELAIAVRGALARAAGRAPALAGPPAGAALPDADAATPDAAPAAPVPSDPLIGSSAAMAAVSILIRSVASCAATVLVIGETGTGKELVSRAIHDRSARSRAPFVAINCAAVPAALLESELFGHVRGAFTDAWHARRGVFIEAGHGTLFLDEIGEMPLAMQVKLLRVLQERMVRPVGSSTEIAFHARVIAATHRDLEADVAAGRFREDLFYRLNVVQIAVPALRSRPDDIEPLARHFIARVAARAGRPAPRLAGCAVAALVAYEWPGNVRELENCVEHALALAAHERITVADLPRKIAARAPSLVAAPSAAARDADDLLTLAELERRHIREVMRAVHDNRTRAARVLGIDRRSLFRRLQD